MTLFSLIAIILATYRLSHLLNCEEGPFDICLKIRVMMGIKHDSNGDIEEIPEHFMAKLFGCLPCLSVWMAGLVYLVWYYAPIPVWILAGSGGAMLIRRD